VQRHEVLRTTFVSSEDGPMQQIEEHGTFALQLIDLRGYASHEREEQIRMQKMEEGRNDFDLRAGPLLRGRLLRLRDEEHLLLVTMHHIVSDGWSIGVFVRELCELYSAYHEGRATSLSAPPIQYADYAQWQREWLQGERLDKQLDYWRSRLADAAPELHLPAERARPAVKSFRGERVSIVVDEELSAQLRALARSNGMTLFMVLYAAWAVLLSRLTGQDDIVIGAPVANRRRPELEGLIGFFVNTLALRADVNAEQSISDFLSQVKRLTVEAYEHQDVPFEQLVEALRPQRSLNRHPVFQVVLALQNAPPSSWTLPGLSVSVAETINDTAKFDLLLSMEEQGSRIVGYLNYDTDLFDRVTASRWIACFQVVLRSITSADAKRVADLQILPPEERRQLVEVFNAARPPSSQNRLIHDLFEEQVRRSPDAPAVTWEGQTLTYEELNSRANQLARHLRDRGTTPDSLVGLCVERGFELVVGALGILKSGAAYLPLDPNYPPDRLQYMLEDAAPRVVLTQEVLRERLPQTAAAVIALDGDWQQIAANTRDNLDPGVVGLRPHHLAYVIYTSGSTGKPKGVMVEHRNVTRLFAATQHWFHFNEDDVWTLFHSFAFDFSVWELWGALFYGGRVIVVPHLTARSPDAFYRLLCDEHVTVLNQTPSAFTQLSDAQTRCPERDHALRVVVFGGEALELRALQPWVERNGVEKPQLVNMYGITETTVHVTYRRLAEHDFSTQRRSPIGVPIPDLQVHILDRHRHPLPIGVVGEMYVGGAGVARGYLNRPELTAERFVLDPFNDASGVRLYRSGDMGRWRNDGTLEYLGRNDDQVKIRGFRIELGEIEAQLVRHPQIKDTAVLVREDVPGEKRIVAYVVPASSQAAESQLDVSAVRMHLKGALPEYMVPSAFVSLEHLPLTSNGKLDRRALPAPDMAAYGSREYEMPEGQIEEIVAGIWQSLLRVQRVGRRDNFFELGGHSLLIVQMMERLRHVGLSTDVRRIFESPTLADLADALTESTLEHTTVPDNLIPPDCQRITPGMLPLVALDCTHIERIVDVVPGGAGNIQDIYPLAPLQEGILFHHLLTETGGDVYVLPIVLSVSSRERLADLMAALQAVIDRHDVLRTSIMWEQLPRPVQVVWRRASLPVAEVTLDPRRATLEQVSEWLSLEKQRLDLQRAPLMRLQVAADPHSGQCYALLQFHHIVDDATSMRLAVAETVAHLQGRMHELPDPVPYRDHVAQALDYARTHDAEEFFRQKLGDVHEPTAPFGLLNVHGDGALIREAREDLALELSKQVRAQARRLSVSAATVFHAAWGLVLAQTTGRDDVVFGSVLLGRLHGAAGVHRTLGMFINTLPLRLRLHGMSAKQFVEHTQRELVELLSHEQASLAVAQRCSAVAGATPLFATLFNYRHAISSSQSGWSSADGVQVVARQERTNYPITLSVDDLGEGFSLTALTDHHVDPHRITAFLRTAIEALVDALEDVPMTAVSALSALPESERRQVVRLFNATASAHSGEQLIHQLFEDQVRRTPHLPAVVHGSDSLTYAQLSAAANRLARYLVGKGAGPGRLIGICVQRSVDMVVSLLGILKAGAAYVPLDPNYPRERLRYMIEDAAPALVLVHEGLKAMLPPSHAEIIALDAIAQELSAYESDDIRAAQLGVTSGDLVYVIYTSGSTGQPKGTAMPHCSMVNLINWHRNTFGANPARVLQFAALSFDVAFQETFSTLCTGGTLVMLDEEVRKDARALTELITSHGVERLFVPPLMLQSLAEYSRLTGQFPSTLRDVITAGEALRITNEIIDLFRRLDRCRLHNHYGPTETHVVTALTLTGDPRGWPSLPTIGRPIANTQIYILDSRLQPTPLGIIGEIHIGGANVARGYWNRPELTAQRFISDPYGADAQARLYKTGDLGRWREDGTIEYLGRNDDQVKIRGFRIELGEIEDRLGSHDSIREAAVVAHGDASSQKRLVAYVTIRDGSLCPSVEELRAHLQATLPDHMIPSAFVALDSLPLTPTGKLNRRALPAPEQAMYCTEKYQTPAGPVEESLAAVWQEVLAVDRVGRDDNFFDLGGHSLLVLKVLFKITQSLNAVLTVTDIYKSPTIRQLAARIGGEVNAEQYVDLSREAALGDDIVPLPGELGAATHVLFLTGATGFVGRFLLAQLLVDTAATVFCLVRAPSQQEASRRLRITLAQWDLWRDEFEGRIVAIAGDLRRPRLGLDASTYRALAECVDTIYHCATSMNHLETYEMARAANVDAAQDLLRLATECRPKLINYVSTVGVFNGSVSEPRRRVDERTSIEHEKHSTTSGYVASKWVAEKIFMTAEARGIACNIFRLGFIWADSQQGRYDELQRDYRTIKSCLLSGYGIEDYRYVMPPTPVDYAARAMVFLAEGHRRGGGIFHISSLREFSDGLFERCNELFGTALQLQLQSFHRWIGEMKRLHQHGLSLPVVPLIEFAFSMDEASFRERQGRVRAGAIHLDWSRTNAELEQAGIVAPALDDRLLRLCVESMLTRDPDLQELASKVQCTAHTTLVCGADSLGWRVGAS
jgi:amino acid adenylation domain-containing protein/thioester reductase-like protein